MTKTIKKFNTIPSKVNNRKKIKLERKINNLVMQKQVTKLSDLLLEI